MLFALLFLAPTTGATLWSLWSRRVTWTDRWERGATVTVLLMAVGVSFTSPVLGPYLCEPVFYLTGYWNLEDVVGDMCLILAAAGIAYMAVGRVLERPYARRFLRIWVDTPVTAAVTALLACFVLGHGDAGEGAISQLPLNGWIETYWILLCLLVAYLLCLAIRVLRILRAEARHRVVATMYIATCVAGVLACINAIMDVLIGYTITPHAIMLSTLSALWVAGFAVSAGYSWRRKRRLRCPTLKQSQLPPIWHSADQGDHRGQSSS